jgi:hypothetical protein
MGGIRIADMGTIKHNLKNCSKNLKGKDHLEALDVEGRLMLKWIIWLMIDTSGMLLLTRQ